MYTYAYLNSSNQLISYSNGNVLCENVKHEPMQGYSTSKKYFLNNSNTLYELSSSNVSICGENVKYYYANQIKGGNLCLMYLTNDNKLYNIGSSQMVASNVKTLYYDGVYITNDNKVYIDSASDTGLSNVIEYNPDKQQVITTDGKYYQGAIKVLDSGINWYQDEAGDIYYYSIDPSTVEW